MELKIKMKLIKIWNIYKPTEWSTEIFKIEFAIKLMEFWMN